MIFFKQYNDLQKLIFESTPKNTIPGAPLEGTDCNQQNYSALQVGFLELTS
jgi:hypothetical protein